VAPSTYVELGAVTLAWPWSCWARPGSASALFIGIAMALYGLSLFNLHYWGFGLPYIIGGSWYLVRAYRLSEKLKLAKAAEGGARRTGHRLGPPVPSRPSATPTGGPGAPSPVKPKPARNSKPG
jgi:hypothetical protein